jgi:DNA-binding NarL/FixJ family response regulator
MKEIRLLIVDDESRIRRGLEMRLATEPDMEVVGQAESAATALELAKTLRPDVVIMDLKMPGMDGITATACLCQALPSCQVLILTMQDDATTKGCAMAAGAAAFVAKQEGSDRLVEVIRAIARGTEPEELSA